MLGPRRHVFSRKEVAVTFLILVLVSVTGYSALWWVDFAGIPGAPSPWALVRSPGAVNAISNFGDVTIGVLGVALTVVTIIVELASNRYTPRITDLFIRDPVNAVMMSFFVCTGVIVLWTQMSVYGDTHPETMVAVAVSAMSLSLLLLIPYFAYVFDFLLPTRVVNRIQLRSVAAIRRVIRRGKASIEPAREEVLTAIEQLGDIALNSVDKKDKAISIAALSAMMDLAVSHLALKPRLPNGWFETDKLLGNDQDFVAMHADVMRELARRRTWVEWKILRQCQAVFDESLSKLRDMGHFIAIHTRRLATRAEQNGDIESVQVAIRFLNTYMRSTLKVGDQRSAYDLMNEYRALAETLLSAGRHDLVLMLAERCKFYGQLAFKMRLPFVLETAAYDLCALLERAHQDHAPCHDALLEIFLDVDRDDEGDTVKEASLRGVRKAQTKLATYYLECGQVEYARRIFEDMRHEPQTRLRSIAADLKAVTDAEWWEVSDRGVNFEYLTPARRAHLETFFRWFEAPAPAPQE